MYWCVCMVKAQAPTLASDEHLLVRGWEGGEGGRGGWGWGDENMQSRQVRGLLDR
jgi:hypothetical protein